MGWSGIHRAAKIVFRHLSIGSARVWPDAPVPTRYYVFGPGNEGWFQSELIQSSVQILQMYLK